MMNGKLYIAIESEVVPYVVYTVSQHDELHMIHPSSNLL